MSEYYLVNVRESQDNGKIGKVREGAGGTGLRLPAGFVELELCGSSPGQLYYRVFALDQLKRVYLAEHEKEAKIR